MDDEEKAMIADGVVAGGAEIVAAPAAAAAPLAAPEPAMKIVRNYKKPEVWRVTVHSRHEIMCLGVSVYACA
jgi:hypothetical protein